MHRAPLRRPQLPPPVRLRRPIFGVGRWPPSRHGGGGIEVELLDFAGPSTLLLKWKEVACLQFFVEHYREDLRPHTPMPDWRNQEAYCSHLLNAYDTVQDDTVAMLELTLAFEKCKHRILQKKYQRALKTTNLDSEELPTPAVFGPAVKAELSSNNLAAFSREVDFRYRDAWETHYG